MSFEQISASEAKKILKTNSALLVDIRDSESFSQSHAPEAFHLTQDNLPSFLKDTNRNTPVLVICYHGNSSQIVAGYLSEQGFGKVYSIIGGYEAWNF
ncbi:thiosulfate sulfurtransferase [Dysgonomonas hofstadii]|uniref:Thiosulfate sulfurtransferase n=1 Tax=Dysgonomonas hofstadii TaxID=637886 RepID=A0A840CTQ5_9BACT|nr:thiosulfate sulfurtransferase GlpE [Dysgonomonas hofstadii]MBB4035083.1 thiosulfate sulfurtransferase [Dysgonomonas hofstadii]